MRQDAASTQADFAILVESARLLPLECLGSWVTSDFPGVFPAAGSEHFRIPSS
jgi:hypothetical protein